VHGEIEKNSKKPSVRITGAWAEIRTGNLPNTSQERCRLSQLAGFFQTKISYTFLIFTLRTAFKLARRLVVPAGCKPVGISKLRSDAQALFTRAKDNSFSLFALPLLLSRSFVLSCK
jgi:hypothetical protein